MRRRLAEMKIAPTVLTGEAMSSEVRRREERIASVATRDQPRLPNFPLIVLCVVVFLFLIAMLRVAQRRQGEVRRDGSVVVKSDAAADKRRRPVFVALVTTVALIVYVTTLQWRWLGYVPATAIFVSLSGGVMAVPLIRQQKWSMKSGIAVVLSIAVVMSVLLHHLFTEVLIVDLP